ncbi:MAG: glucose-6-phosphate isomerase [Gammaproteobacteria bacterium]|nr:glucose-6-phosphate isomerase [Gammaproteobacteria bacterium]
MTTDNKTGLWQTLRLHQQSIANSRLQDLFSGDEHRVADFSIQVDSLLVDYSKNSVTRETIGLLLELAKVVDIPGKIAELQAGKVVNTSENRPALHTALRRPGALPLVIAGTDISALVQQELARMQKLVEQLHSQTLTGSTGKPIQKIVNIGIGGSDLGPRLVTDALYEYKSPALDVDFVANLDAHDLFRVLNNSNPHTSLFIVTSKSFSTLETQTNALSARRWLIENGCRDIDKHFIAVSSNRKAVMEFGISADRIFAMWDWVGGRYSVWSAVGLPVAIALGMDRFLEFLGGAHAMDNHFRNTPLVGNIPVILGLLDVWYNNFCAAETRAVVPYDQRLRLLPDYLSQLVMESNGKRVTDEGQALAIHSTPVVWGSIGTNAQHAFFQMLHQGTRLVPVEFLLPLGSVYGENHHKLVANCLAQGKALMLGQANTQEPHRHFPGNRPSTTLAYENLTPKVLGMLLAMYEHRTYVQAKIWGINPFDQWGVELGKTLANEIIDEFEGKQDIHPDHDPSTKRLIEHFLKNQTKR